MCILGVSWHGTWVGLLPVTYSLRDKRINSFHDNSIFIVQGQGCFLSQSSCKAFKYFLIPVQFVSRRENRNEHCGEKKKNNKQTPKQSECAIGIKLSEQPASSQYWEQIFKISYRRADILSTVSFLKTVGWKYLLRRTFKCGKCSVYTASQGTPRNVDHLTEP